LNGLGTRNDDGRGGGKIKGRASRIRLLVIKTILKMDYLELHFFSSQKINTSNTNRVVVATAPRPGEGGRPGRPTNSPHETNDGFVTWMGVFQFEFFFTLSGRNSVENWSRMFRML